MYGNSLHNKYFTYDGCGADTNFTIQIHNTNKTTHSHSNNSQSSTTFTTIDTKVLSNVWNKRLRLLMLFVVWKLWNIRTKLLSSSNIKQHFHWIVQCLDFSDVLTYSSLKLHLTLSGVVCYCDVALKYINNMKKISWNESTSTRKR